MSIRTDRQVEVQTCDYCGVELDPDLPGPRGDRFSWYRSDEGDRRDYCTYYHMVKDFQTQTENRRV